MEREYKGDRVRMTSKGDEIQVTCGTQQGHTAMNQKMKYLMFIKHSESYRVRSYSRDSSISSPRQCLPTIS
jgi:hypothetical protein